MVIVDYPIVKYIFAILHSLFSAKIADFDNSSFLFRMLFVPDVGTRGFA